MTTFEKQAAALTKASQVIPPGWWWCASPLVWTVRDLPDRQSIAFTVEWFNHDGRRRFVTRFVSYSFLMSAVSPLFMTVDAMMKDVEVSMHIGVDQFASYLRSLEDVAKCEWSIRHETDTIDVTQTNGVYVAVTGLTSVVLDIELVISHKEAGRLM